MEYYIEDTQDSLNALQDSLLASETYFHLLQYVNALNKLNGYEVFNLKYLKAKYKIQKSNDKSINQKTNLKCEKTKLEYQKSNIKNEISKSKYQISDLEYRKAYMKLLSHKTNWKLVIDI